MFFGGIFGRVVQLLWKWNVVRRTCLLTSTLDRRTHGTMKWVKASLLYKGFVPTSCLPPPLYREKKEQEREESSLSAEVRRGKLDPKKTTAKKKGLLQYYCPFTTKANYSLTDLHTFYLQSQSCKIVLLRIITVTGFSIQHNQKINKSKFFL
jgi:hypothetical protein